MAREYSNELLVSLLWSSSQGDLTRLWHIVDRAFARFCLVFLYVHFDEKLEGVELPAFLFTPESEAHLQTDSSTF